MSANGFYTFLYGMRIGDAKAPPFLKYRSSNLFITATVALAVFTVSTLPNQVIERISWISRIFFSILW